VTREFPWPTKTTREAAGLLLLHLGLCGRANIDDRDAAGQDRDVLERGLAAVAEARAVVIPARRTVVAERCSFHGEIGPDLRLVDCRREAGAGCARRTAESNFLPVKPAKINKMKTIIHRICKYHFSVISLFAVVYFAPLFFVEAANREEVVGERPYEMVWADRTKDDHKPLIDFELQGNWTVEATCAAASFERSREQQIWGDHVAKLKYRAKKADNSSAAPLIKIRPPMPVPVPDTQFDAMYCWIRGNHWGRGANTDPSTPPPFIDILFQTADGNELAVPLVQVIWKDWYLAHKRFDESKIKQLNHRNVFFNGFLIRGGTNDEDRIIYFDNFTLFKEEFKPLEFSRRPKRGIDMFPGQPTGQNTGEGRLPFPIREETILPDSSAPDSRNMVRRARGENEAYEFVYEGADGTLVIQYFPKTGTWTDFVARWNDSEKFVPLFGGGINQLIAGSGKSEAVIERKKISVVPHGDSVTSRWKCFSKTAEAEVEFQFRMIGKSLVMDTFSKGGKVPEITFGKVRDIANPRAVLIPYFTFGGGYGGKGRPAVLVFETKNGDASGVSSATPLFLLENIDWYRSNASQLYGRHSAGGSEGASHGGALYIPKTDGVRNDLYERFFLTISPKFEEVLPTIPNPKSPWKHIAGTKLWRVHAAHNRQEDRKIWKYIWRHGIRDVVINDHETAWRDGGDSFTFRTKTAPGKGGDQAQFAYARYLQDELGYRYGTYNNFTDFAPINEFWDFDLVGRTADNQLQPAWMRNYGSRPSRAVEFCEKLTPLIQEKFRFSTAYCDVHTSVLPWNRTDYDPRVPGAGTFAATYYAYGEIMLLQKKGWNGPVYSEGPNHFFYSGLTDGNYAQDQGYRFVENPWLVDFDLRKMHDLECNFGMGNLSMFSPAVDPKDRAFYLPNLEEKSEQGKEKLVDRFLAATLAFGHPGFLVLDYCFDPPKAFGLAYGPPGVVKLESGISLAMRSYFMIQQIASRYTQSSVDSICYADENGRCVDTSEAILKGVLKRNHLVVRYTDGTTVIVNGNRTEPMKLVVDSQQIELPPNGYTAWTKDRAILVQSLLRSGMRYDYCESPRYIFFDGRGTYQELPKACGKGPGVCRILPDNQYEIISLNNSKMGFAIDISEAVAFDFAGRELGKAKIEKNGKYVFIEPMEGAFSYTGSR